MSEANRDNQESRSSDASLSLGALLRCAADAELSPAQMQQLRRRLEESPDNAARIEFEKELRRRIAGVMSKGAAATPELRARIVQLMTENPIATGAEAMIQPARVLG